MSYALMMSLSDVEVIMIHGDAAELLHADVILRGCLEAQGLSCISYTQEIHRLVSQHPSIHAACFDSLGVHMSADTE